MSICPLRTTWNDIQAFRPANFPSLYLLLSSKFTHVLYNQTRPVQYGQKFLGQWTSLAHFRVMIIPCTFFGTELFCLLNFCPPQIWIQAKAPLTSSCSYPPEATTQYLISWTMMSVRTTEAHKNAMGNRIVPYKAHLQLKGKLIESLVGNPCPALRPWSLVFHLMRTYKGRFPNGNESAYP